MREPCPTIRDEAMLIVREALANAVRHAGATTVVVEAMVDAGDLAIRIRDDGRGFDVSALIASGGRPGHWGLPGMRERARARNIGGTLDIRSPAGEGTELLLRLPSR